MVSMAITAGQLIQLLAAFLAFVGVMAIIIVGLMKSLIAASDRSIDSARDSIEKRLDQQSADIRDLRAGVSADIRDLRARVETREDSIERELRDLSTDSRGLAVRVQNLEG
jgi:F0F1-type ATP synthase membrane subunit b/b'